VRDVARDAFLLVVSQRIQCIYLYLSTCGHIKDENISKDSNKPGSLSMANSGTPHACAMLMCAMHVICTYVSINASHAVALSPCTARPRSSPFLSYILSGSPAQAGLTQAAVSSS
jgi:hypothetical protein